MKLFLIKLMQWILVAQALIPLKSFGESSHRALVVIDMQPYFVTRVGDADAPANKTKVDEIFHAQIDAILEAKKTGTPIIFMEYFPDSKGATDERLKNAAQGAKVVYFAKSADGMLDKENEHRKALQNYIRQNKIDTFIMTGANGGACVKASILDALGNNLSVVAYEAAIADFNYRDFLYPYDNYYKEIHPSCKSCTFRETSDLADSFSPRPDEVRVKDVQKILNRADEVHKKIDKMSSPKGCGT